MAIKLPDKVPYGCDANLRVVTKVNPDVSAFAKGYGGCSFVNEKWEGRLKYY